MSGSDDETKVTVPKFSSFKSKPSDADIGALAKSATGSQHGLVVPRFSSSRPKKAEEGKSSARQDEHDREGEDRKRRHHSTRDREQHSKRRRHESHRSSGHGRKRSRSPGNRGTRQTELLPRPEEKPKPDKEIKSDLFFFDKKGDPLIIKYGGIERSKIPAYYRYGGGRVLGTRGRLVMHRDGARDQFSLRMPGEGSALFKDKDGLRAKRLKLRQQPPTLRAQRKPAVEEEPDGYLALGKSKKDPAELSDPDSSDGEQLPNYRSIELKPKKSDAGDSHSSSESEGEIPPLDQSNPLKWRSIQLSRQVKEHPEDIDSWIALVDHQEILLRAGETLDHQVLENEAHSYTEIKVSMLESALSNVKEPRDRIRVLNYLMREGVKIWNTKTAVKKWTEVAEDERDNFVLWKTHLDFCTSNIASFQFDEVKQMLVSRLKQATSRQFSPHRPNDWSEAVYVFLRATRFIYDAGYRELAVAAWQSLFELNFFHPPRSEDEQRSLDDFQDFWESEALRIGENGAQGWTHFVQSGSDANVPEPVPVKGQPEPSRDYYKAWAQAERFYAKIAQLPARTMDEGTEDDPFRVVMYSDIEPLLFVIPNSVLSALRHQLVDAFLIFCGLPPYFISNDWTETARKDPFLFSGQAEMKFEGAWDAQNDENETTRKPPAFTPTVVSIRCTPELLFPGSEWFRCIASASKADSNLARTTVQQLAQGANLKDLAIFHLCMGPSDSSVMLKKLAKTLLKQYPHQAELYDAYALAESADNNRATAVKVLESSSSIFKDAPHGGDVLLWKTWAWLELESGHKNVAVKRLCSSADEALRKQPDDGAPILGSYILKAHQSFTAYNLGDLEDFLQRAQCLAMLAYLTSEGGTEPSSLSQGNITAAISSIYTSSHELRFSGDEGAVIHEKLLQFAARLLYFHATRGPFRRAYLQEQLLNFLERFPQNTILLTLLEWADSSLRVVDQTRTLLYDKILVQPYDCISSRIFAIEHELRRGNVNSTKAAFEHAVNSDAARSSPQIWISYIRFCQLHQQLRPKAKEVFYRALRHCPWSKDVMMEAFGTLIKDMESAELKSVYNTMTSKGLRVHVDLDEFLAKRDRGR